MKDKDFDYVKNVPFFEKFNNKLTIGYCCFSEFFPIYSWLDYNYELQERYHLEKNIILSEIEVNSEGSLSIQPSFNTYIKKRNQIGLSDSINEVLVFLYSDDEQRSLPELVSTTALDQAGNIIWFETAFFINFEGLDSYYQDLIASLPDACVLTLHKTTELFYSRSEHKLLSPVIINNDNAL